MVHGSGLFNFEFWIADFGLKVIMPLSISHLSLIFRIPHSEFEKPLTLCAMPYACGLLAIETDT